MTKDRWLSLIIGAVAMGVTPTEWNFFRRVCGCVVISLGLLFLYWIAKGIVNGN